MKKTLLLCLTLLLSITLAACGTSDDSNTENNAANDSNSNETETAEDNNEDTNSEGENENTDTNDTTEDKGDVDLTSVSLSAEDAMDAFLEHFPGSSLSSIQLDEENGELVYDIDGYDDSMEYSAEIDQNGDVISEEREQIESDEQYNELVLGDYITAEEALSTASEAPETEGITARGWSLEFENGSPVYEINFEDMGSQEVDVYIDAESGEQLHVEVDD
ncbi:PepSY domain-containing protein [Oceanobacillus oncorhynchi]|uniref:PepSY domain-containing protein n=1 Tax=Oceanobacillus oncorhynchi TaxID=545501 RepID=UPI0018681E09|nr:PepSY domain-containing protein [Oceanobacillus oncorhynchi]